MNKYTCLVGTPVFRSCNRTECENEAICTTPFNIQVALDLQINFINSVSMIEGPTPYRIEVSKEEDGNQISVLTCSQVQCMPNDGFSFRGTSPNNLSLLITDIDTDFSGTYTARATVRRPFSSTDLTLTKVFTSK